MQSRTSLSILVILTALVSVSFAQTAVKRPGSTVRRPGSTVRKTADPDAGAVLSFPYIAEIAGNNVNIRSGPGTNYYPCGKLNKGDKVKVVSHKFSWSCIVPPAGSFSWISTQYVRIDPNSPAVGIVVGDNVRVWVGAQDLRPMYSTEFRLKLNKGEKVKLLGEERDKYYKIAPPIGAYRWVSTDYTKPLGAAGDVPSPPGTGTGPVVPTKFSVEASKLKEYYALEKQIEAECTRPIEQQDYANMKKALLEMAGNKEAGKAARYAEFALKQISRYELARDVGEAVRRQDDKLRQDIERIEKAIAARLAAIQDLGRFGAVGRFETFEAYPGYYRIVDDSNKTVCCALPKDSASKKNLSRFVGRKVGLVGTIELHLPTKGALVRFAEIIELK